MLKRKSSLGTTESSPITPDRKLALLAETLTPGVRRIGADDPTANDAHEAGYLGAGVSVAVLDTGIDLTHPDLVSNIDAGRGRNCMNLALPPTDGHGHGTHVAGIIAAEADNSIGVVGVAPEATIVPIKVLDDTGNGTTATVMCGVDYVTGLNTDADPANDVQVVNMSLGDTGTAGACDDGSLRQSVCTSVAAGIAYVVAAGNSTTDAATFYPANYAEVIAVSAITDLDGLSGGLAGCCADHPLLRRSPGLLQQLRVRGGRDSAWSHGVFDVEGRWL